MGLELRSRDVNYQNLRDLYEHRGPRETCTALRESLEKKLVKPEDFSIQELAEALIPGWRRAGLFNRGGMVLREEAVDSTAFQNITGQIMYTKVMQGWQEADQGIVSNLVEVVPTKFNGEKIPGMGQVIDEEFQIAEGMPYDETGFGEHYLTTPSTTKYGLMVSVTKENLFFDQTGLLLKRAAAIGDRLATGRLKRVLKVVLGITNNYNFDGSALNTYQAATPWINTKSNPLVDWRDIEEAMVLMSEITDPDTGNPIEPRFETILVPPDLYFTARQILTATEVRKGDGSAGTGTSPVTVNSNPVAGLIPNIVTSAIMKQLLVASGVSAANSKVYWYAGRPKLAFNYMENWPLTMASLDATSEISFTRDIVAAYKASERGVACIVEPRYMIQNTN